MLWYRVALVGYVVSLSEGTELVRGEFEVMALSQQDAKRSARAMARAEVEAASLVVLDVVAVYVGDAPC